AAIKKLTSDPLVGRAWQHHQTALFGLVHFLKNSGRYTLYAPGNLGKGDFNIYRMFAELAIRSIRPGGISAQIVPEGFRGGANASAIRQFVMDSMQFRLLVSFVNVGGSFFPEVHGNSPFSLYVSRAGGRTTEF